MPERKSPQLSEAERLGQQFEAIKLMMAGKIGRALEESNAHVAPMLIGLGVGDDSVEMRWGIHLGEDLKAGDAGRQRVLGLARHAIHGSNAELEGRGVRSDQCPVDMALIVWESMGSFDSDGGAMKRRVVILELFSAGGEISAFLGVEEQEGRVTGLMDMGWASMVHEGLMPVGGKLH